MATPPVTAIRFESVEILLGPSDTDAWAELDVAISVPGRTVELKVPAFVSEGLWRFRYSSESLGNHRYRAGEYVGAIEVVSPAAESGNRDVLPFRVSADHRHFEHVDGSPFLWIGDTWWHGFVVPKISDDEFRELARLRFSQGFSVIQIVVLPPEAGPFDGSVRSRSGWAWAEGFDEINVAWWDDADRRIRILLDEGLVPCIVGSWGYHLGMMDDRQALRLWREMVARWGSLPVTWCLAGEPSMLWYQDEAYREILELVLSLPKEERLAAYRLASRDLNADQLARLNLVARSLRELDSFSRPVTVHMVPLEMPWAILEDSDYADYWMLQTGHAGVRDLPGALSMLDQAYRYQPTKPVLNGECGYEGIGNSNWEDVQRLQVWSHMLSGAAGHTYGAHGIWGMNTQEHSSGLSSGSAPPWKVAKDFSGARSVGFAGRLLRRYEWWTLVPRPELVARTNGSEGRLGPFAAELADGTRLVYLPSYAFADEAVVLRELGSLPWVVNCVDLATEREYPSFTVTPDADGTADLGLGLDSRPTWGDILVIASPHGINSRGQTNANA